MNERQLRAFLPAVLEVQQTPPLAGSRMTLWAILAITLIAIIWACISRVDIVAVAQGRIIPDGRVKTVQPLEAGVVKAIHVYDGQHVAAGDLLLELDPTATDADLERLLRKQQALRRDSTRLRATLVAADGDCAAGAVCALPALECSSPVQVCQLDRRQLQQAVDEYRGRLAALRQQGREKQAALRGLRQRLELVEAILPMISERARAQQSLYKKHLASRVDWLKLEQQRIEQEKQRGILHAGIDEAAAGVAHIDGQVQAMQAGFRHATLRRLDETDRRLTELDQELRKAGRRNRLQTLRASIAGTVQQLAVHTLGGVVTPAQALMKIVPERQGLKVQAWVRNQDIGHIHVGQAAEIKVEAFPFTRYGVVDGRVLHVSPDAVTDERRGLAYLAEVGMARDSLRVGGRDLQLVPGMAVAVEVREGQRRLIEFLLDPLLRYRDEALRER